jgi:hypothetical protein
MVIFKVISWLFKICYGFSAFTPFYIRVLNGIG